MPNIINYQGNANENQNETPLLHTLELLKSKRQTTTSAGENTDNSETPKLLVGLYNGASTLGNSLAVPRMLNTEYHITQQFHS